jgi:hypothetical protein
MPAIGLALGFERFNPVQILCAFGSRVMFHGVSVTTCRPSHSPPTIGWMVPFHPALPFHSLPSNRHRVADSIRLLDTRKNKNIEETQRGQVMGLTQAFLLGIMVAWTPSLIALAVLLRDVR